MENGHASSSWATLPKQQGRFAYLFFTCSESDGCVCSIGSTVSSVATFAFVALPLILFGQVAAQWPSLPQTRHSLFSMWCQHSSILNRSLDSELQLLVPTGIWVFRDVPAGGLLLASHCLS